ncbi:MAG: YdeI/OmpD-associated family protein [Gemmatimonadaceae bacterium]|nr:YdeI/OmpD-associated family protein [Gemmatimonadaceae bacterium]
MDEALCHGWIDGVRHSLGDDSYTVRFTPRKAKSIWSNVNIAKVGELLRLGHPAAWRYFQAQTTGYRRLATHYVVSAKRPETRERRLSVLIEHSDAGKRLPQTVSPKRK